MMERMLLHVLRGICLRVFERVHNVSMYQCVIVFVVTYGGGMVEGAEPLSFVLHDKKIIDNRMCS